MPAARRGACRVNRRAQLALANPTVRGWLMISPPFIYALLLLVGPILVVVAYSFWTQDYLEIRREFTLDNYRAALTEPIYRDLLMRSLWISATVSVVTVLLSYPVAYFISFRGGRFKSLWLFAITVPFWSGYLLRILSWKVILGYNGILNTGLLALGLIKEPLTSILYNANAVVITLTHSWVAFAILPIFLSLERIPRTLIDASSDLGASGLQTFVRIVLPLSLPGVITAATFVFVLAIGDFLTPQMVGGQSGFTFGRIVYSQFGTAFNWPFGAALSAILAIVVIAVIAAGGRFNRQRP